MSKVCVFLDNGHGSNTKGKCSPDGFLKEFEWSREIVKKLSYELKLKNIEVYIVTPETTDISLTERVRRINNKYAQLKKSGYKCFLISVHINAAGSDNKWHNATGWSGWVSKNSSNNSKKLAQILYNEAYNLELKGNRWVPECKYWEANYTILTKTNCPAVLTENMFQDNLQDAAFLKSEEGKNKIVQLHINGILKYIDTLK